eukprot:2806242-Rhodomonas_salina.2
MVMSRDTRARASTRTVCAEHTHSATSAAHARTRLRTLALLALRCARLRERCCGLCAAVLQPLSRARRLWTSYAVTRGHTTAPARLPARTAPSVPLFATPRSQPPPRGTVRGTVQGPRQRWRSRRTAGSGREGGEQAQRAGL